MMIVQKAVSLCERMCVPLLSRYGIGAAPGVPIQTHTFGNFGKITERRFGCPNSTTSHLAGRGWSPLAKRHQNAGSIL